MSTAQVTAPPPAPRRLVTGYDEAGKSILTTDEPLAFKEHFSIIRNYSVWTTESIPTNDNNNGVDGATRTVPGMGLVLPNGTAHQYTDLAPGATIPMHRTNSVDYNILISGHLVLILDDDSRTELKAGECIVQRGTMHSWHNPSTAEWARWVNVTIHAVPTKVNGHELEEGYKPAA